jgi:hypothetical protein
MPFGDIESLRERVRVLEARVVVLEDKVKGLEEVRDAVQGEEEEG